MQCGKVLYCYVKPLNETMQYLIIMNKCAFTTKVTLFLLLTY